LRFGREGTPHNQAARWPEGKPRMLFEGPCLPSPLAPPNYDVSRDGQRFLMLKSAEQEQGAPTQISIVLNWFEELKRRVPVGTK
jgi:hypothetical protein